MSKTSSSPPAPTVVTLAPPRRLALAEIELDRRAVSQLRVLIGASVVGALLTCTAQLVPWSNHEGRIERGFAHGGSVVILLAAVIAILALRAWRQPRHGRIAAWSIIGTLLGVAAGFAGMVIWVSSYFDHVEAAGAEPLHKLGSLIILISTSLGMAIGLPAFHRARRAREAADKSDLPGARALE